MSEGRSMAESRIWLILATLFFVRMQLIMLCNCQYITYISSKGLSGNISFDYVSEQDEIIMESYIESAPGLLEGASRESDNIDPAVPILLDWTIHTKTLDSSQSQTCSDDELGSMTDHSKSILPTNQPIVLNKLNRWSIPIVGSTLARKTYVASLLWGRSISLKLSNSHLNHISPGQPKQELLPKQDQQSPELTPPLPQDKPKSPLSPKQRTPIGISKPQLNGPASPVAPVNHTKPNFLAPRPKPSLLNRSRVPSSASELPKPSALVMDLDASASDLISSNTTIDPGQEWSNGKNDTAIETRTQSLVLDTQKRIVKLFGKMRLCSNIVDTRDVKTMVAHFEGHISGKVEIRNNQDDTSLIYAKLYHLKSKITTRHDWKILTSDILDDRRHDDECKYLSLLFDPNQADDTNCKPEDSSKCKIGDLTKKHGQIQVSGQGKTSKSMFLDLSMPLAAFETSSRAAFLVVYEVNPIIKNQQSKPKIIACTQLSMVNGREAEALFHMDGVRGSMSFAQRHPSEPTFIKYNLFGLEGNIRHYSIRELPVEPRSPTHDNSRLCNELGALYNPQKTPERARMVEGVALMTMDMLPVGNLSGKHGNFAVVDSEYEDRYMGDHVDLTVSLFGTQSIIGRSMLLHKDNGDPWVCAVIDHSKQDSFFAAARFYYPLVGQVLFQQLKGEPNSETGVLIDLYNPNGEATSDGHNWLIHTKPAMADFYNWSSRCESVGEVHDVLGASLGSSNEAYSKQCLASLANEPLRCRMGDTSLKSSFKLSLATSKHSRQRLFYSDPYLPLSGPNSILAKSVVVYDDNAPAQRGNRLACSSIKLIHSTKAAAKSWSSGPSIPSDIRGQLSFEQVMPNRPTHIGINLKGFNGNVEHYAVHQVWTMDDREFPCSNDSLYDIYDPFNIDASSMPLFGSTLMTTVDRLKSGDLSRKHGSFEQLQSVERKLVDLNAPLFAPASLVGRSIILRAAVNDFRWVCGTIEFDYDRREAREIVALASFEDPRSRVLGFVRFTQIEYKDSSLSDTLIQIDLKPAPGSLGLSDTSYNHNWAIFVNQVGEDAFIAAEDVRCLAAGFKWNPYLAADSRDSYPSLCSGEDPRACAMGDLGLRHGHLTLGPNQRRVVSDSNLPLTGNYSNMARSLVIFDSKRPHLKLACANLLPDIHLKSSVVIKRSPSFTVARFVEQMRTLLGAAEWLVVPELRATKSVANGECVQMTIHFYGQRAHQLQEELSNLVTYGSVHKTTRFGSQEKISTQYKHCRLGDSVNDASTLTSSAPNSTKFTCGIDCIVWLICLLASRFLFVRISAR